MLRWISLAFLLIIPLAWSAPAHADVFIFETTLSGPNEDPPNASPGTGFSRVTFNDVARTMRVEATFSGLIGNTTAAHIHGLTPTPFTGLAGVMTQLPSFSGFPLGVTAGAYDTTFDMTLASSYSAGFLTANGNNPLSAGSTFLAGLVLGRTYLNIHTSSFGGGEIRGFYRIVPEPASVVLMGLGAIGVGLAMAVARRRASGP